MIDTDKYTGHTPAPWVEGEYIPSDEMIERFQNRELQGAVMQRDSNIMVAMIGLDGAGAKDRKLIADAPKILAEYKKLREGLYEVCNYLHHTNLENEDFMELMYKLEIFERDDEE